jgi:sarcosine oxidase
MATDFDVIVVGLGGMGSAAAHHLARRGVRVLGLEQHTAAHDRGSSHGGSRLVRQAYYEDPAYVPLLRRAYELWDDLARDSGAETLVRTGGLMIGRPDSRVVTGTLASAAHWDLAHEVLDAAAIRRRFPTLRPADDEVGVFEAVAGFVRPEDTVRRQLRLAAEAGAELHFTEPVRDWRADGDEVIATTALGTYTARRLVLCPGAWAPSLLARLGLTLAVERQVQHWFQPVGPVGSFRPGSHPVFIWECPDGVQFYGFPATDGPDGGVKVAFFRRGRPADPDQLDREIHPAEIEDMRSYLAHRIPALSGSYLRGRACMYTNTPDEHFVVDRVPGAPNCIVAAGFSGHGFKFVPVVGEILADLATDGRTDHPIGLFAADRLRVDGWAGPPGSRSGT